MLAVLKTGAVFVICRLYHSPYIVCCVFSSLIALFGVVFNYEEHEIHALFINIKLGSLIFRHTTLPWTPSTVWVNILITQCSIVESILKCIIHLGGKLQL